MPVTLSSCWEFSQHGQDSEVPFAEQNPPSACNVLHSLISVMQWNKTQAERRRQQHQMLLSPIFHCSLPNKYCTCSATWIIHLQTVEDCFLRHTSTNFRQYQFSWRKFKLAGNIRYCYKCSIQCNKELTSCYSGTCSFQVIILASYSRNFELFSFCTFFVLSRY